MTESVTTALSFFPSAVGIKVPQTDRWQVGTLIRFSGLGTLHELVRHDRLVSSSLVVKVVNTMSMTTTSNTSKRSIASEILEKKERFLHPRFVAGLWGQSYRHGPAHYTNVDGGFDLLIMPRQNQHQQQQQQQAPRFDSRNWFTNRASLPDPPPIHGVLAGGDTTCLLGQRQPIRMFTQVPITATDLGVSCRPSKSTRVARLDAVTKETPIFDGTTSPMTSPSMIDSCDADEEEEEQTILDTTHRDSEATSVDDKNSKVDATTISEEDTEMEEVSTSIIIPPRNNTTVGVSTTTTPFSAVAATSPRPLVATAAASASSQAAHSSRSDDDASFDDGASHESTATSSSSNVDDHDGDIGSEKEGESPNTTTKIITMALLNMTITSPPTTLATISTASVGTGTTSDGSTTLDSSTNINDPPTAACTAHNTTSGSGSGSLVRVDVDLTGLSDSSDEEEAVDDTDLGCGDHDVDPTGEPGQQESDIDGAEGEDEEDAETEEEDHDDCQESEIDDDEEEEGEEVETQEDDDDDGGDGGGDENVSTENAQGDRVLHRVKVVVSCPRQPKFEVVLWEDEELLLGSSPSQPAVLGRRAVNVPLAEKNHCVLRLHIMRDKVIGVNVKPFENDTTQLCLSHGGKPVPVFKGGTTCGFMRSNKVILNNTDGASITEVTFEK